MNPHDNLTPQQSLDLIAQMINQAKGNLQKNNFYFLLWGWVVAFANVGMFTLTKLEYDRPYIVWLITVPAWAVTLFKAFGKRKETTVITHLDKIGGYLWITFGISVAILVIFGSTISWNLNPVILIVSAIPTLVAGVVLKFRPLMIGGILFWLFGIVSFMLSPEYQPLAGAAAIISGYVVPGYMLRKKEYNYHVQGA